MVDHNFIIGLVRDLDAWNDTVGVPEQDLLWEVPRHFRDEAKVILSDLVRDGTLLPPDVLTEWDGRTRGYCHVDDLPSTLEYLC